MSNGIKLAGRQALRLMSNVEICGRPRRMWCGRAGSRSELAQLIGREWLVTNGLGGYASGTLAGPPTRRYHSLLVAALPAPLGPPRAAGPSRRAHASGVSPRAGSVAASRHPWHHSATSVSSAGCRSGATTFDAIVLEKRILMPNEHNSILSSPTRLSRGDGVRLGLRPDARRTHARGASQSHGARRSRWSRRTSAGST